MTLQLLGWTLLIGLAAFRLWRLLAVDTITEPIHGRLRASTHPVTQWIDTLVSCSWCLGLWINAAIVWTLWATTEPYTATHAALITFAASTITGLTATIDERLHS